MRHFRIAALAAFFVPILFLAGCATPQALTPAQAAARVCAVVQPSLQSVVSEAKIIKPAPTDDQLAALGKSVVIANTFCADTARATNAGTESMMNAVFPVVMGVVANSSLDDKTRSALLLSLAGVQTAANVILAK